MANPSTQQTARFALALLNLKDVGRKTAHRALTRSKELDLHEAADGLKLKISSSDLSMALERAERTLRDSEKSGIRVVTWLDSDYPKRLRDIPDPPPVLHVKGDIDCLNARQSVAIIGTREPSDRGRDTAQRIAASAAKRGFVVVSGLAKGCDAEAHRGCLKADGRTVAVLAHGLDRVYPAENKQLAADILDGQGCWMAEYAIGQPAYKTAFIDRDRLQSGLSQAVIVIETGIKGGSHHTVSFAVKQKRRVACVQYGEISTNYDKIAGNIELIHKRIAQPLSTGGDVERFFFRLSPEKELPTESNEDELNRIDPQLDMFGNRSDNESSNS